MTILNLMKVTKFSKRIENTVRKGEIAHYEQFLLFSSTGQRPASYCHGVVSVLHPLVCPFLRLCVRASVKSSFKKILLRNY